MPSPTIPPFIQALCPHDILIVEWMDEFAGYTRCLSCGKGVAVETEHLEAQYMGFESTDPPSWDKQERTTLLIKRETLK